MSESITKTHGQGVVAVVGDNKRAILSLHIPVEVQDETMEMQNEIGY